MLKYFFILLSAGILMGCKNKKPSLKDDDGEVEISDFIEFFDETSLPVKITDTGLSKKLNDSAIIGYKVFTQFVPDSVLQKDFGKTAKPVLHALGRAKEKGAETYL